MKDADKILKYLEERKTISLLEAWQLFGTISIRERIRDLRDRGVDIETKMVINPQTKRRHAVYSLKQQ